MTVVLDLMQPAIAFRRFGAERDNLQADAVWHGL